MIGSRQRPSILLLVPPDRQLADGDGAVQEGDELVKAAAQLLVSLGEINEVVGNEVVVKAELVLVKAMERWNMGTASAARPAPSKALP